MIFVIKLIKRGKKRALLSERNGQGTSIFISISRLYFILRSIKIVKNVLTTLIFSQFTPIYVPKNLSNAPAQVLTQLRHWTQMDLPLEIFW